MKYTVTIQVTGEQPKRFRNVEANSPNEAYRKCVTVISITEQTEPKQNDILDFFKGFTK